MSEYCKQGQHTAQFVKDEYALRRMGGHWVKLYRREHHVCAYCGESIPGEWEEVSDLEE